MRLTRGTVQTLAALALIVGLPVPPLLGQVPVTPVYEPAPLQHAAKALPDLVGVSLQFKVVENTTWGTGTPCQIYNITPTIKNQGRGPAGPFKVQLQRKKDAGYVEGCLTCTYSIDTGLAAGEVKVLDVRQANNCGGFSWNWWRIVVDSAGEVREGSAGELNNKKIEKEYKPPIHISRTAVPVHR